MATQRARLAEQERTAKQANEKLDEERRLLGEWKAKDREAAEAILGEKSLGIPWLADAYADYCLLRDMAIADSLEHKRPPARKSADEIRRISREKAAAIRESRIHKYLIQYYEDLFPWLTEFRGEDLNDLVSGTIDSEAVTKEVQESEDQARRWLSEAEYRALVNDHVIPPGLNHVIPHIAIT